VLVVVIWLIATVIVFEYWRRWSNMQRSRVRLRAPAEGQAAPPPKEQEARGLARWLYLAGYRSPAAPLYFILATAAMAMLGFIAAFLIATSDVIDRANATFADAPPGLGELSVAVLRLLPFLIVFVMALLPTLIVRANRRRIVTEVEQDLPVMLELLATLAESGLGFDAALDRVLRSQREPRALQNELRTFQAEVLAGRPRVQCLRRLARRLEVPAFSSFVSAVVQAEQTGSGIASVLRRQANDLRVRRRERALEFAMSLPVKRLLPMVICFLPAIFVAALGPNLYEIYKVVDRYVETGTLGGGR
jgi:pilus assembly protein TadC